MWRKIVKHPQCLNTLSDWLYLYQSKPQQVSLLEWNKPWKEIWKRDSEKINARLDGRLPAWLLLLRMSLRKENEWVLCIHWQHCFTQRCPCSAMFSSPPADFFCGWVDGLPFSVWQRWSKVGEADNAKMSLPVWMGVWPWEGLYPGCESAVLGNPVPWQEGTSLLALLPRVLGQPVPGRRSGGCCSSKPESLAQ